MRRWGVLVSAAALLSACSTGAPSAVPPSVSPVPPPATAGGPTTPPTPCPLSAAPGRFTGGGWRPVAAPPDVSTLTRVVAASPDAAWAVGTRTTTGGTEALVLGWDGTRWQPEELPAGITSIGSVTAAGPREAWAVGTEGEGPTARTRLLHRDGTAWADVAPPAPGVNVRSVASDRCTRVYVGGEDARQAPVVAARSWDRWITLPTPSTPWHNGRGTAGALALAPGSRLYVAVVDAGPAAISSWDGSAWKIQAGVGGPNTGLERLTAFSDRDVWYIANRGFVGSGGLSMPTPPPNQVYAASLTPRRASAADPGTLRQPWTSAIAGWTAPAWLAGSQGLSRFTGKRWVPERGAVPAGTDIDDLVAVPGSGQLWAVGTRRDGGPVILRFAPG